MLVRSKGFLNKTMTAKQNWSQSSRLFWGEYKSNKHCEVPQAFEGLWELSKKEEARSAFVDAGFS